MSDTQTAEKTVIRKSSAADPNVQVPAAIRAASARSDALHKAAYNTEPAAEPEQEPAPKQEPQQTPQQPAQQETQPTTEPEQQPAADDWERRYKAMKGRYDQSQNTINGLTQRLGEVEANLARMAKQPEQPNPELRFTPQVTAQERADYGEDFLDVASRAAREKLDPEITSLKQQLARLEGQLGGVAKVQQDSTAASMYSYLDNELQNWRDLNRDPKFLAWVNLPDAYSGAIRLDMMRDAYQKADGQRVLRFFNGFLADEAATDPAKGQPPLKAQQSPKVPLTQFAAPGRAKAPAASTQAPGEKETISRSQIANFYALVGKGHYRGNPEEKTRLEEMIFEAEREGRVIDG